MSPPYVLALCFGIGALDWYLALRRTLACARGERVLLSSLVFTENILGFLVLYYLFENKDFAGIVAYAAGGALGAQLLPRDPKEPKAAPPVS